MPHVSQLFGYVFDSSTSQPILYTNVVTTAMGTTFLYQVSQPNSNNWSPTAINFGLPYFSISIGLNTLLTLMIVARIRSVRTTATSTGATRLYSTIITMLVESSALYAVNSLLFIGSWAAGSHIADVFSATFAGAQARAFFIFPVRYDL